MVTFHTRRGGITLATLAGTLRDARMKRGWSLRDVQRHTGIHNAHLSQIENATITRPDHNVLFALAKAYELDYGKLLRMAGHIEHRTDGRQSAYGPVAFKTLAELTDDEQREVVEYMLRLKDRRGPKRDQ
jgi:transcriptional regulator with XRE-family HTH domain